MFIPYKKQFNYVWSLTYPINSESIQKDIDDTDSIDFARFVSRKVVKLCAERIETMLANDLDDFDIDKELSDLHETLAFAIENYHM